MIASTAWAVTVKNVSPQPVTYGFGSYKTELAPGQSAEISREDAEHPIVRRLVKAGKLVIEPVKHSIEYCQSDDYPGDPNYCYLDLAQEQKSTVPCAYLEMWDSIKECLYYVDRERKLTVKDCLVFDPGSQKRASCEDYVKSGIPSKPGQSYEHSK